MKDVGETVAQIARESRAKLVAFLAARTGDIASAEDAVAEAMRAALEEWPAKGIPDNPEGWLFTVATRRQLDLFRKLSRESELTGDLAAKAADTGEHDLSDERLRLFFVCAHPGIDENVRAALMLQTILGLDAARIASAYLVSPAAMAKRLVRAKEKIRISKIPFAIPELDELAPRTTAVLEAIYLARMLSEVLPQNAEVLGLLALMLFSAARAPARRDASGAYIPLAKQNTKLWKTDFILEADAALKRAAAMQVMGPFQLEAAIQAVHTARGVTGTTDWAAICELYAGLVALEPTVGAQIAFAAALMEKGDISLARERLSLVAKAAENYQPYWAVLAELSLREHKNDEAAAAFRRAAALSTDAAVRNFLLARISAEPQKSSLQ